MMLHVHKDRTDALTLVDAAYDFVGEKENPKQLFGKFSANDIPNNFSISSKSTQTEKSTQLWLSDMYQEVSFNRGTEVRWGRGINVGYSLSPPPQSFCVCYGPVKG